MEQGQICGIVWWNELLADIFVDTRFFLLHMPQQQSVRKAKLEKG